MGYQRDCTQCGQPFALKYSSSPIKFCGRPCFYAYQREHPERWGGEPKVSLICAYCGQTYERHPSRVRAKETNFCSRRCMSFARSPYLREGKVEYQREWVKECEWCGAKYRVTKARDAARRRYCSEPCGRKAHKPKMRGEGNPNYRHGQHQKAARDLVIRDGRNICIICGWDVSVDLHHIIPKRRGGRISPENIAILCPNHHRMAHMGLLTAEELTRHVLASLKTRTLSAETRRNMQALTR